MIDMGGGPLMVKYRTLGQLLIKAYPELTWESLVFSRFGDIWNDESLISYYLGRLQKDETKLEINYVHRIIRKMGSRGNFPLLQSLKNSFVGRNWFLISAGKKSQYVLKECISKFLKGEGNV